METGSGVGRVIKGSLEKRRARKPRSKQQREGPGARPLTSNGFHLTITTYKRKEEEGNPKYARRREKMIPTSSELNS